MLFEKRNQGFSPSRLAIGILVFVLTLATCSETLAGFQQTQYALTREHRLKKSLIYEREVESLLDCGHLRLAEVCRGCKSINIEKEETMNIYARKKCQLNNETKTTKPERLVPDPTFNYYEVINMKESDQTCEGKARESCADLYKNEVNSDGVYTIDPDGEGTFDVWCDMTTDEGGWTVFQRRMDGSVNFYRDWSDYKNGFGNLSGEFWLGLDKINRLSKNGQDVLRVDLEDFENNERFAKYDTFAVADESDQYNLTVGGYSGNARDSLKLHNGMKFTTKDKDNDQWHGNCAVLFKGAWWYEDCLHSHLNGLYLRDPNTKRGQGVIWYHWKGFYYSLKKSEMKVRPKF